MRTNQYAYLLVAQVLMACLVLTVGPKVVELPTDLSRAPTSEVQQPGDQGGLLDHLRR